MYDASLFVATSGTKEELFGPEVFVHDFPGSGEQMEVGGRPGAVEVGQIDPDTKLDGPIVTLSRGLEDGRVARANTVRLDDRRSSEFQFELDGRSVQLIGENQGSASLLGQIVSDVRTTRTVDGVEMA